MTGSPMDTSAARAAVAAPQAFPSGRYPAPPVRAAPGRAGAAYSTHQGQPISPQDITSLAGLGPGAFGPGNISKGVSDFANSDWQTTYGIPRSNSSSSGGSTSSCSVDSEFLGTGNRGDPDVIRGPGMTSTPALRQTSPIPDKRQWVTSSLHSQPGTWGQRLGGNRPHDRNVRSEAPSVGFLPSNANLARSDLVGSQACPVSLNPQTAEDSTLGLDAFRSTAKLAEFERSSKLETYNPAGFQVVPAYSALAGSAAHVVSPTGAIPGVVPPGDPSQVAGAGEDPQEGSWRLGEVSHFLKGPQECPISMGPPLAAVSPPPLSPAAHMGTASPSTAHMGTASPSIALNEELSSLRVLREEVEMELLGERLKKIHDLRVSSAAHCQQFLSKLEGTQEKPPPPADRANPRAHERGGAMLPGPAASAQGREALLVAPSAGVATSALQAAPTARQGHHQESREALPAPAGARGPRVSVGLQGAGNPEEMLYSPSSSSYTSLSHDGSGAFPSFKPAPGVRIHYGGVWFPGMLPSPPPLSRVNSSDLALDDALAASEALPGAPGMAKARGEQTGHESRGSNGEALDQVRTVQNGGAGSRGTKGLGAGKASDTVRESLKKHVAADRALLERHLMVGAYESSDDGSTSCASIELDERRHTISTTGTRHDALADFSKELGRGPSGPLGSLRASSFRLEQSVRLDHGTQFSATPFRTPGRAGISSDTSTSDASLDGGSLEGDVSVNSAAWKMARAGSKTGALFSVSDSYAQPQPYDEHHCTSGSDGTCWQCDQTRSFAALFEGEAHRPPSHRQSPAVRNGAPSSRGHTKDYRERSLSRSFRLEKQHSSLGKALAAPGDKGGASHRSSHHAPTGSSKSRRKGSSGREPSRRHQGRDRDRDGDRKAKESHDPLSRLGGTPVLGAVAADSAALGPRQSAEPAARPSYASANPRSFASQQVYPEVAMDHRPDPAGARRGSHSSRHAGAGNAGPGRGEGGGQGALEGEEILAQHWGSHMDEFQKAWLEKQLERRSEAGARRPRYALSEGFSSQQQYPGHLPGLSNVDSSGNLPGQGQSNPAAGAHPGLGAVGESTLSNQAGGMSVFAWQLGAGERSDRAGAFPEGDALEFTRERARERAGAFPEDEVPRKAREKGERGRGIGPPSDLAHRAPAPASHPGRGPSMASADGSKRINGAPGVGGRGSRGPSPESSRPSQIEAEFLALRPVLPVNGAGMRNPSSSRAWAGATAPEPPGPAVLPGAKQNGDTRFPRAASTEGSFRRDPYPDLNQGSLLAASSARSSDGGPKRMPTNNGVGERWGDVDSSRASSEEGKCIAPNERRSQSLRYEPQDIQLSDLYYNRSPDCREAWEVKWDSRRRASVPHGAPRPKRTSLEQSRPAADGHGALDHQPRRKLLDQST